MMMLIDCSNCRTALQHLSGAWLIKCAICHAITRVADPLYLPPPPPPSPYGIPPYYNPHQPPPPPVHHYGPPPIPSPSPYNYAPSPSQLPSAHGPKRAVICGISYRNSKYELKGCINDAKCMKYLLVNRFKFPESSVLMLTEEETDPYRIPTKHNIVMAMFWLIQGCKPGDSLVFYYSGHGSQQINYTGDEIDGFDEILLPLDFDRQGMIVDDEINATLVKPIPHGVKLHAIIDACHSGTMLDLSFLCRMDRSGRYVWEDHIPPSGVFKGTNGGEVISFSGCDDDQTSADTWSLSKVTSTGAMTYSFIQAIEHGGQGTTYGDLLNSMRYTIRSNETGGGMRQEPQLTASEPFDVYTKRFEL